jgi:urease accessory protein
MVTLPAVTAATATARTIMTDDAVAVLRLCHLVSPALPIGAYAYSQGLEYAVHAGWVHDEASTLDWILGLAARSVGTLDLPLLARLHAAWRHGDGPALHRWNSQLIAMRETAELRAEERHLGAALRRVLVTLEVPEAADGAPRDAAYATLFALACVRWQIALPDALRGYLWAWSENQVLAAIKLVPLGQSAGQRVLSRLLDSIPSIGARALEMDDSAIGIGVIASAIGSALHESQYTRLFRS